MSAIFCLDNDSHEIMLYDQYSLRIKAHISISSEHLNNCKILDFAVSEQEKQVGACLDDYTLGFWGKGDEFKNQRIVRFTSQLPLQLKIWFIEQRGKWLTCGNSNALNFWDLHKDEPTQLEPLHREKVMNLVEIRAINAIAVACLDKTIWIWDMKTLELRFIIKITTDKVAHKLVYSEIFQKMFTAGFSGVIDVWKFDTHIECSHIARISGHTSPIMTLQLIEDLLLSVDQIGVLRTWNVKTLECLQCQTFEQNLRVIGIEQISMTSFCVFGSRIVLFSCKLVEVAGDGTGMAEIQIPGSQKEPLSARKPVIHSLLDNRRAKSLEVTSRIGQQIVKKEKEKPMEPYKHETEIVDIGYNWVMNQFVIATRSDVRIMSLVDGRQKKIFTFLLRYNEEITSFYLDSHLRKFFLGGHTGALKCFSLTNATVLKQFPLTSGEQSYINMDIKNQLLITGSYDSKFLSVQRIPSDQGTFQQYRKLKNPVGSQDVIGFDVSFATNMILVVCSQAGLLFHYESFQFKGFCDTLFLQHPQTSKSPTKRRSSYIIPQKYESSPCGFSRTHISSLEYDVRQGIFLGEYAVVALVASNRNNENDCFTILYSLTQQERGYVRYLPFLKIFHQSNPLFLANKKLNDGNNVTHITFGLFEKVPANAPFADTMLGNTHLSKSSKSSGIEEGLGEVLSVLAVAKLNGSLQLYDLSSQLKNYTAKWFKRGSDPFRVANESGSALFSRNSVFESEPFINAEFNSADISVINQDYSSRSFMQEWPAHYQGKICMLKVLEIQKQNLIITASEDGFMKMWSKEGRLLACSNVNQILPNIWDFRFNTKKKRLCTMYRAKLVYDSVVQKYSEIAGTKLKPSSKLKPLEFLQPIGEEKSQEERRRALLEHQEEQALILREAIQRYMEMKKVEEAKIHREQHDLDIKLMRQELGLAGQNMGHKFEHFKAQDYIDSAGGMRSSEGKYPRERNFLQNLEVMITRAKGMDTESNPEVQRILNEYKQSRVEVGKFEKINEKVKSMDVIKELGDTKRKTQSKWLAQNLLKVINNKWTRSEKEDFKNVLRVTTRKLYLKKQLELKKRSKNSQERTTSANIIRKIDDSKVSANKAELIKYAKAKNAAIGNQLSEACPVLPDGRPNSLYKYQVQEQIQASRNLEDSFDQEEKLPQPKIRDLLALMNSTVRKYKSCKNFNEEPGDNFPMLHILNLTSTEPHSSKVEEGGIFTKLNEVEYPTQLNHSQTFITEQQAKEIPRREKTPQPVKRRMEFGLPKVSSLKDLSLKERERPNFITHERRIINYQKLRLTRKLHKTPSSFSFKGQRGKGVFVSRNIHGTSGALPSIFAEQKGKHPNASFAFEMAEAQNIKEEQITSNLL